MGTQNGGFHSKAPRGVPINDRTVLAGSPQPSASAKQQPVRVDKVGSRPKRSWPLQADFAVVAFLVVLTGAAGGAFVHFQSDADAKQAAVADANFAAQRAAKQIAFGFDTFHALTVPRVPSIEQFFADPGRDSVNSMASDALTGGRSTRC